MAQIWEDFIDRLDVSGLPAEVKEFSKDALKKLVMDTRRDSEDFLRRRGEDMARYLTQLASGKITKAQFQGYVEDMKDLIELRALKLSVQARARAEVLAKNISVQILGGLLVLI